MWRLKAYQDRQREHREQTGKKQKRLLLQWHVTERCNNRCLHCYQDQDTPAELSYDELIAIADQFRDLIAFRKGPPGHINITGGEPFIREDFCDFLKALSSRREAFSFAVLSNGSFIDAKMAQRLVSFGPRFVQVSIDGSELIHDAIRGHGDFRRTIKAIKHLNDNRIRTLISFTASRRNYRSFEDVVKIGVKLGVSSIWTDRFIPRGEGAVQCSDVLSSDETRQFLETVLELKKRVAKRLFCRTEIAMNRALQFLTAGGEPYRCTAGDTLITVMANGDLVPCRRMPLPAGNVLNESLGRLYRESPLFKDLRDRDRIPASCRGCFYEGLCRGGLRCLSYALTGDPFQKDPGCWLEPDRRLIAIGESWCHQYRASNY